jgi:chromate reductase
VIAMTATEQPIRILAIAGSLREASYARRHAQLAAELAATDPDRSVEVTLFDGLRDVEPFDEDSETEHLPGVDALRAAIDRADAVFVATPEYNASIPGTLKNAFDWLSRSSTSPFNDLRASGMYGKPVAVVSASTGQFGGVWARDELIKALRTQGARAVVEPQVAVPSAANAFDEHGHLGHAPTRAKLSELLGNLADQARAVRNARLALAAS